MKKVLITLLVLGSSVLFAGGGSGGGGKAFGGGYNSDKYANNLKSDGIIYIAGTANASCAENIKVVTHSSVRYRSWIWYIHTWKSGYATTTATQCGKPVNLNTLEVTQFSYVEGVTSYSFTPNTAQYTYGDEWNKNNPSGVQGYINKVGTITNTRSSYIKLGLSEEDGTGTVVTIHSFQANGKAVNQVRVSNEWGPGDVSF